MMLGGCGACIWCTYLPMEGGVPILREQLLLHNLHDHVTSLSTTLWRSIDCDCLHIIYSVAYTTVHVCMQYMSVSMCIIMHLTMTYGRLERY